MSVSTVQLYSTFGSIQRPFLVTPVAVWWKHAAVAQRGVQCTVADLMLPRRGSSLQPDLLPSASPCTHTCSTSGLWWAVSHCKTKQYNRLRGEMHGRLKLLPAVWCLSCCDVMIDTSKTQLQNNFWCTVYACIFVVTQLRLGLIQALNLQKMRWKPSL